VIRLTKFESEGLDEVRTLPQNDYREVIFKRYRNESRPAGMGAKAKGSMLHKLPSRATRVRRENNTKDSYQQKDYGL